MNETVLATVGGAQITSADVDRFLARLGARGNQYNTPEGRKVVLEQLIGNKLLLLDAKRNLFEAEPAFRERLAEIKDEMLAGYAAEKVFSAVRVNDKELEEYYEANKEKLAGGETVNASHILVSTEEEAKKIYEEIASGAITFEDAAKKYSSCPSREEGGSLGDFGRGQMVPEFDTAVFSMEVGTVTAEPVKTQFGYHLIRLNAKNEATIPAFADVKEGVRNVLLQEKQQKAYESKINQLKILYPVDLA